MDIVPSPAPEHVTFVLVTVAESTGGSVIESAGFRVIMHAVLAASLILTLYEPGARFVKLPEACHEAPPLTVYAYVPYPPNGLVIVMVPLFAPKHVTLDEVTVAVRAAG